MGKLVYGVGINDSFDRVSLKADGKQVNCKFYTVWRDMIGRCYSEKFKAKYPSYAECAVCEEWHTFSNFKKWMEAQDWNGKQLDKDLLYYGNKFYSPDNCVFLDKLINTFLTENKSGSSKLVGAFYHKSTSKYQASCKNPFNGKLEHLGLFQTEIDAHKAWKSRKLEISHALADTVNDERVKSALVRRYL